MERLERALDELEGARAEAMAEAEAARQECAHKEGMLAFVEKEVHSVKALFTEQERGLREQMRQLTTESESQGARRSRPPQPRPRTRTHTLPTHPRDAHARTHARARTHVHTSTRARTHAPRRTSPREPSLPPHAPLPSPPSAHIRPTHISPPPRLRAVREAQRAAQEAQEAASKHQGLAEEEGRARAEIEAGAAALRVERDRISEELRARHTEVCIRYASDMHLSSERCTRA